MKYKRIGFSIRVYHPKLGILETQPVFAQLPNGCRLTTLQVYEGKEGQEVLKEIHVL